MESYLMTHSLLSSWLWAISENPYEDSTSESSAMDEFMQVLRREPTETTVAMQKGIDFENLVTDIVRGVADPNHKWYDAAYKVATLVAGGQLQYKAKRHITVSGIDFLLYGRLDCLRAGTIADIKFSTSYERGKFFGSTQHPTYMELIPEASQFTYIVSNGTEVWTESYRREETQDIKPIIADFVSWLDAVGLMPLYKTHWRAL